MSKYALDGILKHLRQELASTEAEAKEISSHFEVLCREAESMKIDALHNYLEKQRKFTARNRGTAFLIKDNKRVRGSLLVAAGSFILGGLLTRDKFGALTAGMSGFDGMVQGFGESKWCVLLGKKISVAPEETISPQVTWITLASFHKTMEELKKRSLAGEKLENLDDVISKLKKKYGLSNK